MFLESEFRWRFTVCLFISFYFGLGCWISTFWEKSCSYVWDYGLFVFRSFVILVISRFGFEGWIWVLIAPISGHCLVVRVTSSTLTPGRICPGNAKTPLSTYSDLPHLIKSSSGSVAAIFIVLSLSNFNLVNKTESNSGNFFTVLYA